MLIPPSTQCVGDNIGASSRSRRERRPRSAGDLSAIGVLSDALGDEVERRVHADAMRGVGSYHLSAGRMLQGPILRRQPTVAALSNR